MNKIFIAIAVVLIAFFVACTETQPLPPPNDPFFAGQEPFGASVPTDASMVSTEEFKRLVQQDELVLDTAKRRQDQKTTAEAQFKSDEAQIKLLAQTNPVFQKALTPDPSVGLLSDGNYLLTVQGKNGAFEVVTDGPRRQFRRLLESRAKFNNVANQLRVYENGFNMLPDNLRTGLPTPASLTGATLNAVLDARSELEKRFAANPDTLEDAQAVIAVKSNTREANPDAKPSGFPISELQEEGRGEGIDHEGNCDPTALSANGLYQNFWWKQKFYHTSVKSQGQRGSCVGFAVTAALEGKIAIEKNRWVNLSEQFLWAKIAGEWDYREYSDGANTDDTADEFFDTNYKLPMESVWNYNKSRSRLPKKEEQADHYSKSCQDYDEFCSNTSHQQQYYCATLAGTSYCGYKKPTATGEKFGIGGSDNIYDWSSWSLPVSEMRALLRHGHTLVAGLTVNVGFDNPTSDGIIHTLSDNTERGGHAVQIVGFISASRVANHPNISSAVKNYAQNSGGGYFILKNSWGYCFGDAGYIYVPVAWAKEYFNNVEVFYVNPSAAFNKIPNVPPTLSIIAPTQGYTFPYAKKITLEANAVDPDSSTPPTVTWSSDKDGLLGTGMQLEVSFNSPGTRTITAVAADLNSAYADDSVTITGVNVAPTASIQAPLTSTIIYKNIPTILQGSGSDNDTDGTGFPADIPCASLEWKSNLDGVLGTGCDFEATFSSIGARVITLTATDAQGAKGTKTVNVNVKAVPLQGPPIVNILKPTQNQNISNPASNLYVTASTVDPDGGTPLTRQWIIRYSNLEKIVTLKLDRLSKEYFNPDDYVPFSCGGRAAELELKVTDPQGQIGTDKVNIYVAYPPC